LRAVLRTPVLLKTLALYYRFADDDHVRRSRTRAAAWAGRIGKLLLPMYRSLIRRAPFIDTAGATYANWLHEAFGVPVDRLRVIPNAFDPAVFSPGDVAVSRRKLGLDRFAMIIGYVGSLTDIRYVDRLIEAVAALRDRGVGLVIVGDGRDRERLATLARESGVSDQVVFTGTVPYARVVDYVRCFDVAVDLTLVTMTVGGRPVPTSYSQKIAQYLGSGVPVVAWDTAETRFLDREAVGATVPVAAPERIAGVLQSLIRLRAEERRHMKRRAAEYARTHLSITALTALRVDAWRAATRPVPLRTARRAPRRHGVIGRPAR
ncbi:MAG: glycosyltransferase, partial [Longimicrobiales bacterium]